MEKRGSNREGEPISEPHLCSLPVEMQLGPRGGSRSEQGVTLCYSGPVSRWWIKSLSQKVRSGDIQFSVPQEVLEMPGVEWGNC